VKRQADNYLRQNYSLGLHELLCGQITATEVLKQENAQLIRNQFQFDLSLAEIDLALKGSKNAEVVKNLKVIIEKQIRQIVNL
jgi:hypothetical protein